MSFEEELEYRLFNLHIRGCILEGPESNQECNMVKNGIKHFINRTCIPKQKVLDVLKEISTELNSWHDRSSADWVLGRIKIKLGIG